MANLKTITKKEEEDKQIKTKKNFRLNFGTGENGSLFIDTR